jgi:hypothetical protein
METNRKMDRNFSMTQYHPQCRLCSYAGFSNICTYSQTGVCPYNGSIETYPPAQQP